MSRTTNRRYRPYYICYPLYSPSVSPNRTLGTDNSLILRNNRRRHRTAWLPRLKGPSHGASDRVTTATDRVYRGSREPRDHGTGRETEHCKITKGYHNGNLQESKVRWLSNAHCISHTYDSMEHSRYVTYARIIVAFTPVLLSLDLWRKIQHSAYDGYCTTLNKTNKVHGPLLASRADGKSPCLYIQIGSRQGPS